MPVLPHMPASVVCSPSGAAYAARSGLAGWCLLLWLSSDSQAGERAAEKPVRASASQAAIASVPGVPGVTVDWQRGVLEASASAAADLYAASVEVARLKAERLARTRAEERLRRALTALRSDARLVARLGPSGPAGLDIRSAELRLIEYGSNGSVVLRLSLPLVATPPAAKAAAAASSAPDAGVAQDASPSPSERPDT